MKELENLARNVLAGRVTTEEGARVIMGIIYFHKAGFGLADLDQDQFHDFLLNHFEQFRRLLANYSPERGTFCNYLHQGIQTSLAFWKKENARRYFSREGFAMTSGLAYEEALYNYEKDEPAFTCEFSGGQDAPGEEADTSVSYRGARASQMDRLRRNASLVLALKSCYYVGDDMLEKVSALTGVPFVRLKGMVQELQDSMRAKIRRREACQRCRDRSYFFRRTYLMEVMHMDQGSSFAPVLDGKLRRQTKNWIEKNEQLREDAARMSPPNSTIGKVLGISHRHVSYIMKKAAENVDNLPLPRYHGGHEDLLSKRKPE